MSNETHSAVKPSPGPEARPTTNSQLTPRRRATARKTSAQEELAEAQRAVKAAREREARAQAKVEYEHRALQAKRGHDCMADLVARLDPTMREMVITNVLSVAREEEAQNVQNWMASLAAKY